MSGVHQHGERTESWLWNRWTFGVRIAPELIDRGKWRNTLQYRITDGLQIGIEYNPLASDVNPLVNWVVFPEEGMWRPALMLGTSSDRIGSPSGHAFFATLSKDLKKATGLPVAPYAGVSYGTYEDKFAPIAGLNIRFPKGFSSLFIFDGEKVHPTVSWSHGRHVFSFLLLFGDTPGLSYSVNF